MKIGKFLLFSAALAATAVSATACGKDDTIKIGILQIASHEALDKATEGFKEAVSKAAEEHGKKIDFSYQNPQGDTTIMTTQAQKLVRECDLVLGNATQAAQALVAAAESEGKDDLPILFTSVTDPVDAKLVDKSQSPGGNVTGTSDINPISIQMDLAVDLMGSDTKIGFLYNASESNSESQCNAAKDYLKTAFPNVQAITKTVPDTSSIPSVATQIANEVNVLYIPTDNLMAANMTTVANVTNEKKIPIICGESGMVNNGGTVSLSISYAELGKTTGNMAADILFNNKKAGDLDVQTQTNPAEFEFALNNDALSAMQFVLPEAFKQKYNIQ